MFFLMISIFAVTIACQRQNADTNCTAAKCFWYVCMMYIHHVIPPLETDHGNTQLQLNNIELKQRKQRKKKRIAIEPLFEFVPLRVLIKWCFIHLPRAKRGKKTDHTLAEWLKILSIIPQSYFFHAQNLHAIMYSCRFFEQVSQSREIKITK